MQVDSRPGVSVLIVTCDDSRTIASTIRACLQLDYPESQCEILVYDDGSSSAQIKILDEIEREYADLVRSGRLRVVRGQTHRGLGASRNAAARAARGDYLCFMDGNAYPASNWLKAVLARFGESSVSIVAPRVISFGQPQVVNAQGGTLNYFGSGSDRFAGQPSGAVADFGEYVLYAAGCGMATTRECWNAVGGFDEAIVNDYDSADYGIRAWTAGYKAVTAPEAVVYHDPDSPAPECREGGRNLIEKSRWRIMLKHWPLSILVKSLMYEAHLIRRHRRASERIRTLLHTGWGLLFELPSIFRYRMAADRNAAHTFWFLLDHRHSEASGASMLDKVCQT